MVPFAIAIDGPAGAGKSTLVKMLSEKTNFKYVDTGAMYRTVALKVIQSGLNTKKREDVLKVLDILNMEVMFNNDGQVIYLDGEEVNSKIRTPQVSEGSSDVAVIPEVRKKLVEIQRKMAKHEDVIMDGRDIGTIVLPNAQIKIFLTATVEERAKRRYNELINKGFNPSFEEIKKSIEERDHQDSNRECDPLIPADDAIIIDSTNKSVEDIVNIITDLVNELMYK